MRNSETIITTSLPSASGVIEPQQKTRPGLVRALLDMQEQSLTLGTVPENLDSMWQQPQHTAGMSAKQAGSLVQRYSTSHSSVASCAQKRTSMGTAASSVQ